MRARPGSRYGGPGHRGPAAVAQTRLRDDVQGVTTTEFALIAPVFFGMLMGLLGLGQQLSGTIVLNNAVVKASRIASLETGDTTKADAMVQRIVGKVLPGATVSSTRKSYNEFTDVQRPERWQDTVLANDICGPGEVYVDENRNGRWDADIGRSGNGSGNDVVAYTVTVTYQPVFAIPFLPKLSEQKTIKSTTVTKNQPFANQPGYGSSSGTCT